MTESLYRKPETLSWVMRWLRAVYQVQNARKHRMLAYRLGRR